MASSSDEGEIIENGAGDLKATSLPRTEGSGVDRQDRLRSRQSTPDHDAASRYSTSSRPSKSPPRGFKRSRDDRDHYGRRRDQDSRPSRSRYDDTRRDDYVRRPRVSYDDLDRPASRASNQSYDGRSYERERERERERDRPRERDRDDRDRYRQNDRDGYPDKRPRNRSRSPQRQRRDDRGRMDKFVREGDGQRGDGRQRDPQYDNRNSQQQRGAGVRHGEDTTKASKGDAKASQGTRVENTYHEKQVPPQPEPEQDYQEPEQIDEEAEIERRRKRREELLSKSSSATPLLLHAVGAATDKARGSSPAFSQPNTPYKSQTDPDTPRTPRSSQSADTAASSKTNVSDLASPSSPASHDVPSPGGIDMLTDKDLMNTHGKVKADEEDGPSAADYDPTLDMQEDERRDELRHGQVALHGEPKVVETIEQRVEEPKATQAEAAAQGDEDEDFDMFAEDFNEDKYATKPVTAAPIEASDGTAAPPATDKGGILEGDDKDGYYKIRSGEVLNGRYQIQAQLGRGMFSGVARAVDITTKQLVAIKIMRNNDALRKGGYTEIAILQKLNDADPDNRRHIVKFERSFDYRGHLCMAFENLSLNLREVLRKFGNNVGINLTATRTYAYQIFMALAHMRKCSIIHADLKPDNILVNENHKILKICDLGTAIDRSDAATAHTEITPYLISRFYRAPEVILGMPYDYGVDMWSIGCTLYELYTGKILFTGDSNNQMLKAIMEVRGRLTPKLYKRGQLSAVHFDDMGQFVSVERDKVLGKTTVRTLPMVKPSRDLRTRLLAASSGMNDGEMWELNQFIDLLEHCLALNPDKRLKPADALKHPFFTAKAGAGKR